MKKSGIIIICVASIALLGIVLIHSRSNEKIPDQYQELVDDYLVLREDNNPKAYDLCYFKPEYEFVRDSLISDGSKIIDTEIIGQEKINEKLYAFLIRYELDHSYEESYSFVAVIEGTPYIIVNKRDIPDELKAGYNEEQFSYYWENGKKRDIVF